MSTKDCRSRRRSCSARQSCKCYPLLNLLSGSARQHQQINPSLEGCTHTPAAYPELLLVQLGALLRLSVVMGAALGKGRWCKCPAAGKGAATCADLAGSNFCKEDEQLVPEAWQVRGDGLVQAVDLQAWRWAPGCLVCMGLRGVTRGTVFTA